MSRISGTRLTAAKKLPEVSQLSLTSSLILDAQAIIAGVVVVPGYREEGKTINDSKTQMLVDYLAKRIAEVVNLMH